MENSPETIFTDDELSFETYDKIFARQGIRYSF